MSPLFIGLIALVVGWVVGRLASRARQSAALWTGIIFVVGAPFILDPNLDSARRCWNAQTRAPSGQQTDEEKEACESTAKALAIALGGAVGIELGGTIPQQPGNADRRRSSTPGSTPPD
jgi:hypothetical protein